MLWLKRELCRKAGPRRGLYPSFQQFRRRDTREELLERGPTGEERTLAFYGVANGTTLELHITVG